MQPHIRLNVWMARMGLRAASVAKTLGVSAATLSRIRNGRARPTLEVAFAIEQLTSGEVPAKLWTLAANAEDRAAA